MIYIVTAMYAEAHPFITHFQLKKDLSHTRFQVFLNEESNLCLIISGTGSIPAAAAVSSICTVYGAGSGDFLLNTGICAQMWVGNEPLAQSGTETKNTAQIGRIFLCNKIREEATGRTFYPDLLYRHGFGEAQIITGANPYRKAGSSAIYSDWEQEGSLSASYGKGILPQAAGMETTGSYLYDMEAAAVYQAGAYYFGPHQMSFLKIISDDGNTENVTPEQIKHLISGNMDKIADYISTLRAAALEYPTSAAALQGRQQNGTDPDRFRNAILPAGCQDQQDLMQTSSIRKDLEKLCLDLHCSRAMSESLRQHIRYCVLAGVDYAAILETMYLEGKLPCKDKREGKQRFEELKERLL